MRTQKELEAVLGQIAAAEANEKRIINELPLYEIELVPDNTPSLEERINKLTDLQLAWFHRQYYRSYLTEKQIAYPIS